MDKNLKITQIDFAILGMLNAGPLSGYKIRKAFESTALGDFSSSPGTVYPALKRLTKKNLIELKDLIEDSKKQYHLTKKGQKVLINRLTQPITLDDIKKRDKAMLLRFAFMENLLSQQEVLNFLESYLFHTQQYIKELEDYLELEKAALPTYGKLALKHGLLSYKANLAWCKHTMHVIKSTNIINK